MSAGREANVAWMLELLRFGITVAGRDVNTRWPPRTREKELWQIWTGRYNTPRTEITKASQLPDLPILDVRPSNPRTTGPRPARPGWRRLAAGVVLLGLMCGCGTTISRNATEQLLTSDAVDRSVAELDFRHFAGRKVYLDTQYLQKSGGVGAVNADYVISSLRQQMISASCLLQDKKEDAEYIVEARIGALGTNAHEVTYGMPANNLLSAASTFVPMVPQVPTIPEIAFAKRHDQLAAAKLSVFAYARETREPVWQSGVSVAKSKAKDSWILGAGPFQRGAIYSGTQFAGQRLGFPLFWRRSEPDQTSIAAYTGERFYADLAGPPPQPPLAEGEPSSEQPTRTSEPAEEKKPAEIERASHEEVTEVELTAPEVGAAAATGIQPALSQEPKEGVAHVETAPESFPAIMNAPPARSRNWRERFRGWWPWEKRP